MSTKFTLWFIINVKIINQIPILNLCNLPSKTFSMQIIFLAFQENIHFDFNGRMAKIDFSLPIILILVYPNLQCPANNLTIWRAFLVFRRNWRNIHSVHTVFISYPKEGNYKCMCLSVCCFTEHGKRGTDIDARIWKERTQLISLLNKYIKLNITRLFIIFVSIRNYYIFFNLNLILQITTEFQNDLL